MLLINFYRSKISKNKKFMATKADNIFKMQAFTQQLAFFTRVMEDRKHEMASMRKQNSGTDGLRMGANQQGTLVQRAVRNVKTDFVDFVDENANVNDDDYLCIHGK